MRLIVFCMLFVFQFGVLFIYSCVKEVFFHVGLLGSGDAGENCLFYAVFDENLIVDILVYVRRAAEDSFPYVTVCDVNFDGNC